MHDCAVDSWKGHRLGTLTPFNASWDTAEGQQQRRQKATVIH